MTLWLVRHAQPLIQEGLCYGQLDVAADPIATRQAADALVPLLPFGAKLYSSKLRRARQLARAISEQRADLSLEVDKRLNEIDFGIWEGVPWNAIPQAAFDTWTRAFDTHCFGDAENLRDLLTRVGQALREINPHQDLVWITHAGVIRAVNYLLQYGATALATVDNWPTAAPTFGKWQCIEVNRSGPFFCTDPARVSTSN